MLISDITGIYTKHNLQGDLYNRACILAEILNKYNFLTSVNLTEKNFLEFLIKNNKKTLKITFFTAEDLRCTINDTSQRMTFSRYYLIPLLDSLKGEEDE